MSSTTPAPYALILIDLAREAGVDHELLLSGTTLPDKTPGAIGARVADEDFRRLAANALRLTGDPALGLHLGERLNLSAHAVLGQAFLTCRNLGEVIEIFERYYHLLAPDLEFDFHRGDDRLRIESATTAQDLPLSFVLECIAAAMRNTLDGLLGGRTLPLRFEFPYARPEYAGVYAEILGDDVRFACPVAAWSFPAAYLDAPLPSSNPALRELYEAECARLLADLTDTEDLASRSRRLLRKFEGQYPQMPQLAQMLNVSARTYRRRLAGQGTSFQAILDDVRREHATKLLRSGSMSVTSIAYRLGFNDPSNFRRAYRRWTGRTPTAVRGEGSIAPGNGSLP
jgi:AraC-like DNA-binding protein